MKLAPNIRYLIPSLRLGDVVVVSVPTTEINWRETGLPYEEGNPVYTADGDEWQCADWDNDRNVFILAHGNQPFNPADLREIMGIIGVDDQKEDFQMELKL